MSSIILVLFLGLPTLSLSNHQNCSETLINLENALFANSSNIINMENAFFPSREQNSRFLEVVYEFEDNPNCVVIFFWSVGSFLFIQPPAIFTYTSLLFNFPSNSIDNVTITLPNECKSLVLEKNSTSGCTCKFERTTFLDMLTRHVSSLLLLVLYATL